MKFPPFPSARRLLAVAMLLAAGGCAAAAAQDAPSLLRTTFIVADLDRARGFYELLGFGLESELGGDRFANSPFPLNVSSERYRLLILGSARAGSGKLGLIVFENDSPKPVRAPRDKVGLGDAVLVIEVADAAALYARLTVAGIATVETPQTYKSSTAMRNGKPLEGKVFHLFDPDGNLIEILQPPG